MDGRRIRDDDIAFEQVGVRALAAAHVLNVTDGVLLPVLGTYELGRMEKRDWFAFEARDCIVVEDLIRRGVWS